MKRSTSGEPGEDHGGPKHQVRNEILAGTPIRRLLHEDSHQELCTLLAEIRNVEPASPGNQEHDRGEVCIANISPRERMKRLIGGVIPFVLALAILASLMASHADRLWRLPLVLLFMAAASGFFQWRDKT